MAKSIQALPASSTENGQNPALKNAAVARCCAAWDRAAQAPHLKGKSDYYAHLAGSQAYRKALPALDGYQGICDFIACVAHGMAIEAIKEAHASKLLYAAQVALSTVPQGSKTQHTKPEIRPENPSQTPTPLPVLVPGRT